MDNENTTIIVLQYRNFQTIFSHLSHTVKNADLTHLVKENLCILCINRYYPHLKKAISNTKKNFLKKNLPIYCNHDTQNLVHTSNFLRTINKRFVFLFFLTAWHGNSIHFHIDSWASKASSLCRCQRCCHVQNWNIWWIRWENNSKTTTSLLFTYKFHFHETLIFLFICICFFFIRTKHIRWTWIS